MLPKVVIYVTAWAISLQVDESSQAVISKSEQVQQYSFPPNNTPISKVYIFGRPVYVRPPFVILQRDAYRQGIDSLDATENSDAVVRDDLREQLRGEFSADSDRTRYHLPERPYPPTYGVVTEPVHARGKPKYPLPQCYTNDSGFMCCNSKLEQVMKDVFNELASDATWHRCNVQKLANTLQNRTQSVFNTNFEVMVGLGDFASKTHFHGDLLCKIEAQDRFILSYATSNAHQNSKYPTTPHALETTSTTHLS